MKGQDFLSLLLLWAACWATSVLAVQTGNPQSGMQLPGRLADITQTVNSALAVVKQLGSSLGGGAAAEAQLVEQLEMLQRGLNSTRYQLGAALPEADREDVSTMLQTISGMNPRASNEEFTHMLEVFHGSLHMLNPTLSSSLRTAYPVLRRAIMAALALRVRAMGGDVGVTPLSNLTSPQATAAPGTEQQAGGSNATAAAATSPQIFSPKEQRLIASIAVRLHELHRASAQSKRILEFFHISKAGGSTMCQLSQLNGCRTENASLKQNCIVEEFRDWPRWTNPNAFGPKTAVAWFAKWGRARGEVPCKKRRQFLLKLRYNFFSNEYVMHNGEADVALREAMAAAAAAAANASAAAAAALESEVNGGSGGAGGGAGGASDGEEGRGQGQGQRGQGPRAGGPWLGLGLQQRNKEVVLEPQIPLLMPLVRPCGEFLTAVVLRNPQRRLLSHLNNIVLGYTGGLASDPTSEDAAAGSAAGALSVSAASGSAGAGASNPAAAAAATATSGAAALAAAEAAAAAAAAAGSSSAAAAGLARKLKQAVEAAIAAAAAGSSTVGAPAAAGAAAPSTIISTGNGTFDILSPDAWEALAPAVVDNYMVRSLLGEKAYMAPLGAMTAQHLQAAKLVLAQFEVVLTLEHHMLSNVIFHKGLGWRANFGSIHAREAQAIVVQKAAEAAEQAAAAEMAAADGITDWAAFAQELDKLQGAGAGGDLEEGGHMLSSVTGGEPAPSSTAAAGTGTGTGAGAAGAAAGDSTGSTAASGAAGATPAAAAAAGAGAAKAPAARREALGMGSARSMLSQKHMKKQLIRLAERNTLDTGLYQFGTLLQALDAACYKLAEAAAEAGWMPPESRRGLRNCGYVGMPRGRMQKPQRIDG